MLRGLWSAASGMAAQKLTIDVIANNLANVNTVGFKKSRADFQDHQTTHETFGLQRGRCNREPEDKPRPA